jgi:hypothetical protein
LVHSSARLPVALLLFKGLTDLARKIFFGTEEGLKNLIFTVTFVDDPLERQFVNE